MGGGGGTPSIPSREGLPFLVCYCQCAPEEGYFTQGAEEKMPIHVLLFHFRVP